MSPIGKLWLTALFVTKALPASGLGPKGLVAPERCLRFLALVSFLKRFRRASNKGAAPD